jgi:hypothetical protein
MALHGGRVPPKLTSEQIGDLFFIVKQARKISDFDLERPIREKNFHTGIFATTRVVGWVADSGQHYIIEGYEDRLKSYLDGPWGFGPVRWLLADTVMLPECVPIKGAQGLWELPKELGRELERVKFGGGGQ